MKQFRGRSPPTRQGALRPLAARSFCEKLQKCWQPFRAATGGCRAGLRGPRAPRLAPAAICGGRGWLGSVRERLQQKVASCPRGCPTGPCGPLPDAKLFARAVERGNPRSSGPALRPPRDLSAGAGEPPRVRWPLAARKKRGRHPLGPSAVDPPARALRRPLESSPAALARAELLGALRRAPDARRRLTPSEV